MNHQPEERASVMTRGTFYQLIYGVIFVVSGYIIHIGIGRYLGPESYGIFGVIVSLLGINYLFLLSGVRDSVSKFTAETPSLAYTILKVGLKVQCLFSVILALFYLGLSTAIGNWLKDSSLISYIRLSALAIPLTALYSVYVGSLNGIRSFGKETVIKIVYSIAKVVLVFGFVLLGFRISGAICGYILASLVALLVAGYVCQYEKFPASFAYKKIISFAIPIIIFSGGSTLLTSLDLLFVKAILQDNSQVGFYTAASNITRILWPIFLAFPLTVFPSISKSTSRGDSLQTSVYIKSSLRYMMMMLVPIAFLISATSRNLVQLFYSSRFIAAAAPLSILIFGMAFFSVFLLLTTIINASGSPIISMIFVIIMIPIDIVLNLMLIPRFQLVGAAMATSISIFVGMFIAGIYVYTRFKTFVSSSAFLKVLLASVVISLISVAYSFSGPILVVQYIVLFTFYFSLLYFLKEIFREDINRMKVISKMFVKSKRE